MALNLGLGAPGEHRKRRERLDLSVEDVAAAAAISAAELTAYEQSAENEADPVVAGKVAKALEAFEETMLPGDDPADERGG